MPWSQALPGSHPALQKKRTLLSRNVGRSHRIHPHGAIWWYRETLPNNHQSHVDQVIPQNSDEQELQQNRLPGDIRVQVEGQRGQGRADEFTDPD